MLGWTHSARHPGEDCVRFYLLSHGRQVTRSWRRRGPVCTRLADLLWCQGILKHRPDATIRWFEDTGRLFFCVRDDHGLA